MSSTEPAPQNVRTLIVDGEAWRVFEHDAAPDRPDARSLVFDSDRVTRRVRNYPSGWRDLDDAALFALSWSI